mmetsp:Transcript_3707/g.8973  ORF Transcript_3707/g.8973 Transcript_3707/m.8973 type:complete len:765 (-) Transcript_3707:696-2990(-)|eukprot:CAMPEP_0178981938 /NCGR_PEP_ID=MMETSP0795-20121207/222_1 /TAXON_ID=88552 /ORGANISM="Amoebophrya sp., Strain Ameob2" /LENGTH=764 /DNA_ID=CAMNT_0020672535 /DNA_START=957 /DNA_END=3251 /DNA_ORIENTATION=-
MMYYLHENCLVMLDLVFHQCITQRGGGAEGGAAPAGATASTVVAGADPRSSSSTSSSSKSKPELLNVELLIRVKRYRKMRRGDHVMALRQHNEMITSALKQMIKAFQDPLRKRSKDRRPRNVLDEVSAIILNRTHTREGTLKILQSLRTMVRFQPVSRSLGGALPGPEPREEGVDPYDRSNSFLDEGEAVDGMSVIPFECLPPMLPNMEEVPYLPPRAGSYYTIVLDLDETLVHYFEEASGAGYYDMRPGCISFLERLNQLGCEIVVFTAATQDYADWVMDQIDPNKLIHHRLYRQHALPWGPLFIKDLSKLGRPLERTLIIDNVAENFMLQPEHGIFIQAWYDDQNDMALIDLQPLLEELVTSQSTVPGILRKYAAAIPHWAGWRAEASDEELVLEGGGADEDVLGEEGDEAAGVRVLAGQVEHQQPPLQPSAPPPTAKAAPAFGPYSGAFQAPRPASSSAAQQHQPAGAVQVGGSSSSASSSRKSSKIPRKQEADLGFAAHPGGPKNNAASTTDFRPPTRGGGGGASRPQPGHNQHVAVVSGIVVGNGPATSSTSQKPGGTWYPQLPSRPHPFSTRGAAPLTLPPAGGSAIVPTTQIMPHQALARPVPVPPNNQTTSNHSASTHLLARPAQESGGGRSHKVDEALCEAGGSTSLAQYVGKAKPPGPQVGAQEQQPVMRFGFGNAFGATSHVGGGGGIAAHPQKNRFSHQQPMSGMQPPQRLTLNLVDMAQGGGHQRPALPGGSLLQSAQFAFSPSKLMGRHF